MPLHDVGFQNTMLDNMWDNVPTFEVGLLASDPRRSGLVEEVPEAGRTSGTAADWSAADEGSKVMATKTLPPATADYSVAAERWGIWVDGVLGDHGPLTEEIAATAGDTPAIRIRVGFNEGLVS